MRIENSCSPMVKAYRKSVVMGGGLTLFPVPDEYTESFAEAIRRAIDRAEIAAYKRGRDEAQAAMRKAMGLGI